MLAELKEAPARIARGWQRTFDRPEGSEGQLAQERETAVSLGLMAQAAAAGPDMTDQQAIFLSASQRGMRDRVAVLLGIPHRSLAQDRELVMIQRELARIEGRAAPPALVRREGVGALGFLPAVSAIGMLGAVRPWMLWSAAVGLSMGFGAIQSARLENAKGDLREARGDVQRLERETAALSVERDLLADAARQAAAQSQATAQTIEQERARRLRAEREARRIRDAMEQARAGGSVDYGFGGVRDDGAASSGAGGDNAAGGNPR